MTLTLASLGPTTAREQDEEAEEVEAPPHLMVQVDLRKGKESNGFLPYSALVDSCATYNFVFQAVADSVEMRPAKSGRQNGAVAKLPAIATVNGELLRTTAIVRHMVHMCDSAGV